MKGGIRMLKNLLANKKSETEHDSVYERRVKRGEIAADAERVWEARISRMEKQKQEIAALTMENRRLHRELEKLQKEIERMGYVHSIDELIDTMQSQSPATTSFNPFATWGNGNGTGSTAASGTAKILSPDEFEGAIPDDDEELAEMIEASDPVSQLGFTPVWDMEKSMFGNNATARYAAYWDAARL